jgi:hypothetical protein
MKAASVLVPLVLVLCSLVPSLCASDAGVQPSLTLGDRVRFSADSFDWRDAIPYLFTAATMPGEQAIKVVLERSNVLRTYVTNEFLIGCAADKSRCPKAGDVTLDGAVDKRIDEIVDEGIFHQRKNAIVDFKLSQQPFPFSEIVAVKSEKKQDTYLILAFADHSYTVSQLQAKYGAPYDTDIVQWYSVFKYRQDSPRYTSKAVFEVDPVNGSVLKVAISLKPKRTR